MPMVDKLTGLCSRIGKAQAIHQVIQAHLQYLQEVLAGLARAASVLQRTDGCLATGARTFDKDFDLAQSMLHGLASCCLCGDLCGIGSAFAGAFEALPTGTAP